MVAVAAFINQAVFHGGFGEVGAGDVLHPLGHGHFAHQDDGALVAFRPVEGVNGAVEAFGHGTGGDYRHPHIAVGGEHTGQQVGLFGFRGEAGGGAAALHVHYHQRYFGHPGQAEALAHQGNAGAGGGGHRLFAGIAGAHNRGDGLDFRGNLIGELVRSNQVALHPEEDCGGRRDGIAGVEAQAGVDGPQSDGLVAFQHQLLVIGRIGRREVAEDETAFGSVLAAEVHGLNVGGDNGVVIVPAPAEPGFHEVVQVFLGHMHQLGQGADDYHIGGPVVAGGTGEGIDGQAERAGIGHREIIRVVDDYAAVAHFLGVGFVGFLVEGNQDIHLVAGAQDGRGANSGLGPGGAAENLGGEGGIGQGVIAYLGRSLGESFGGSNDALSALTGEPDDEVVHLHLEVPPNRQYLRVARGAKQGSVNEGTMRLPRQFRPGRRDGATGDIPYFRRSGMRCGAAIASAVRTRLRRVFGKGNIAPQSPVCQFKKFGGSVSFPAI